MMHNPNFKGVEFDRFKMQAGLPAFTLSCTDGSTECAMAVLNALPRPVHFLF